MAGEDRLPSRAGAVCEATAWPCQAFHLSMSGPPPKQPSTSALDLTAFSLLSPSYSFQIAVLIFLDILPSSFGLLCFFSCVPRYHVVSPFMLLLLSFSRAVWVVLQPYGLTHVPQRLFQVPLLPGAVGWQSHSCSLLCNGLRARGALLSQSPCILGTLGLVGPLSFKGCICHSLPCSAAVLSSLNPQHCNCNCSGPAITCTCMAQHREMHLQFPVLAAGDHQDLHREMQ